MPKILFNPDFSGGSLNKEDRVRYLELCKQKVYTRKARK